MITTASPHNASLTASLGASRTIDRTSPSATESLIAEGPYAAVFAAADSAADQPIIGAVLAAQGGGSFLSTMGVRPGIQLPDGVTGYFVQYLDDYLKKENEEFAEWVFRDAIGMGLQTGELKTLKSEVIGGLGMVQEGLDMLKRGEVSGAKLVILPDRD